MAAVDTNTLFFSSMDGEFLRKILSAMRTKAVN
jgi:hypothetical protein